MTNIKVDIEGLTDAYKLLDKLAEAGYGKKDFSWEYKNHIRSFGATNRHVIFQFNDAAVACWFKLIV